MNSDERELAERHYADGMQYNWRDAESPKNAMLARALLERAAALEHPKALRELAEMEFSGTGGPKNQEHALWLKWAAIVRGDHEALEELSALLETYAESIPNSLEKNRAAGAAAKAEAAGEALQWLGSYLQGVLQSRPDAKK